MGDIYRFAQIVTITFTAIITKELFNKMTK